MKGKMKNTHIVGIDLAMSNSAFGIYDEGGRLKIIPNMDGGMTTPSVINYSASGDEVLVGSSAKNMALIEPERTFAGFKSAIGSDQVFLEENGKSLTAIHLVAELLRYMKKSAEQHTGDPDAMSMAVCGIPVQSKQKQRQALSKAFDMAGIQLLEIIHEPVAAGLAFGLNRKMSDSLVLVNDWGAGTLDCSLIQYTGSEVNVLANSGDKHLGGNDVDALIVEKLVECFASEHGMNITADTHPADLYSLREEAIRVKHLLFRRQEVMASGRIDGKVVSMKITQDDMRVWSQELMDRAKACMEEAIKVANVSCDDIQGILMVGGSSRFLPFREMVAALIGKDSFVQGDVSPNMAVVEGAIIEAAKVTDEKDMEMIDDRMESIPAPMISSTDIIPHSIGVAVQNQSSTTSRCSVILERHSPIPCTVMKRFGSVTDTQEKFNIQVLQGDNGQLFDDCQTVGSTVMELPARPYSEPSLEVTMDYDASGMVKVHVKDLVSNYSEDITVDHFANV